MTLKFYNGTDYTGQSFTTATECLNLIRDNLIGAGWFVELDDINPNLVLKMKGFDEDQPSPKDECFIQFYSDTAEQIKCKMYFIDNTSTLQESPVKIFNFADTKDNKLYMTCDSGAGVLLIKSSNFTLSNNASESLDDNLRAIHFGFLQRITFDDKNGIALGEPDFRLHNCFMQKTYHQLEVWENIHRTWAASDNYHDDRSWGILGELNYSSSDYLQYGGRAFPVHTTTDFILCTFSNIRDTTASLGTDSGYEHEYNAAYMMWKGGVNAVTGAPLLNRFGYIEGKGRGGIYGGNMSNSQSFPYNYAFRGWVKFVCTGMASLLPLQQIEELNGDRWISSGRAGFQGILIDQI